MRRALATLGTVVRDRTLLRIEVAFLIFNMTEYATWIAILVYAYARDGAAGAGAVVLIQVIPAATVAPFVAYAGDRYRRDRVLFVGFLAQATAMGLTAAALLAEAPTPLVYGLAAASATSVTVTRPALGALLPSITSSPEELTAANVASGIVEGAGIMLGPILGGALLALGAPGTVFAAFAALTVVAAALTARLPLEASAAPREEIGASAVWRRTLGGFRALAGDREVRTVVSLLSTGVLVVGALDVLFVAVAIDVLDLGESGVGYLNAAFGAGGVLGAAASVALVGRRRLAPPFVAGSASLSVPITLVAGVPVPLAVVGLFGLGGGGRAVADIAGRTLLQRVAPDELLARVFGVLEGLAMLATAVGSVAAAALVESFGVRTTLVATGIFIPVAVLVSARRLLAIDRDADTPDAATLELLRTIAIFAPLPAATLERLVRSLEPVGASAGTAVIAEGEPGDRYYVIADGEATVTRGGSHVADLGPGEGFGEIALLRDVPRTATVTAVTDLRLFALAREPFLEAVTGHPQSLRAAADVTRARTPEPTATA